MSAEKKKGAQNAIRDGIRLYILDNGRLECDANLVVAGTVVGTKEDNTPSIKWIRIPTYGVLIEHPEKNILYDLGTHPDRIYPDVVKSLFPYSFEEDQRFEKQLALAGFEPKDISTVILSHLHFDHCGNIDLFQHADGFVVAPAGIAAGISVFRIGPIEIGGNQMPVSFRLPGEGRLAVWSCAENDGISCRIGNQHLPFE